MGKDGTVKKTKKKLSGAAALGAGPGRPKGVPNKISKNLKDAVLAALNHGEGAEAFFLQRKEEDPNAFMAFLKGILPSEVQVTGKDGEKLAITVNFVGK